MPRGQHSTPYQTGRRDRMTWTLVDFLRGTPLKAESPSTVSPSTVSPSTMSPSTVSPSTVSPSSSSPTEWILYTYDPHRADCPFDCLFVHALLRLQTAVSFRIKTVTEPSCSPRGHLPSLVAERDGQVLELHDIVTKLGGERSTEQGAMAVAIETLLGRYLRNFEPAPSLCAVHPLLRPFVRRKITSRQTRKPLPAMDEVVEFLSALSRRMDTEMDAGFVLGDALLYAALLTIRTHLPATHELRLTLDMSESLGIYMLRMTERIGL